LIEKGKKGEVDLFSAVMETPDRKEYLSFTPSYFSFPIVLFAKEETPYIGNLAELHEEKVAVMEGTAIHEILLKISSRYGYFTLL